MKTLEQIKNDVALEKFKKYGCKDWFEVSQLTFSKNGILYSVAAMKMVDEVAKRYAQQACEDLRERITEQAKVKTVATPLGDYHEVNKESILNTEIILP